MGTTTDYVNRLRKCAQWGRDGGISGVALLIHQCPVVLWHPLQNGASVNGLDVRKSAKESKGKKRKKAALPPSLSSSSSSSSSLTSSLSPVALDGTPALLDALSRMGVVTVAKVRADSKLSKIEAARASKAVAGLSTAGLLEGFSFCGGAVTVPNEAFALVLKCLGWEQPSAFAMGSRAARPRQARIYSRYRSQGPGSLLGRELLLVVPRVAKSWLAAAQDPALHKSLEWIPSTATMTTIIQVLQRPKFSLVERLCFSKRMKLGPSTSKMFKNAVPNLRHVDAGITDSQCHATVEVFDLLLECAPNLESLAVDTWNLSTTQFCDAARRISTNLRDLHVCCIIHDLLGYFPGSRSALPQPALIQYSQGESDGGSIFGGYQ